MFETRTETRVSCCDIGGAEGNNPAQSIVLTWCFKYLIFTHLMFGKSYFLRTLLIALIMVISFFSLIISWQESVTLPTVGRASFIVDKWWCPFTLNPQLTVNCMMKKKLILSVAKPEECHKSSEMMALTSELLHPMIDVLTSTLAAD